MSSATSARRTSRTSAVMGWTATDIMLEDSLHSRRLKTTPRNDPSGESGASNSGSCLNFLSCAA